MSRARILDLPREVISRVLDCVEAIDGAVTLFAPEHLQSSSMNALSTTCSAFRIHCQRRLYQEVAVFRGDVRRIVSHFDTFAPLAEHVTTLTLVYGAGDHDKRPVRVAQADPLTLRPSDLLSKLRNLEVLVIRCMDSVRTLPAPFYRQIFREILTRHANLRALVLRDDVGSKLAIHALVNRSAKSFPMLLHLTTDCGEHSLAERSRSHAVTLTTLRLRFHRFFDLQRVQDAVQQTPSLQTLSLEWTATPTGLLFYRNISFAEALAPVAARLRTIRLFGCDALAVYTIPRLSGLFTHTTHLQTLILYMMRLYDEDMAALPTSLQAIGLFSLRLPLRAFTHKLESGLPQLAKLTMVESRKQPLDKLMQTDPSKRMSRRVLLT